MEEALYIGYVVLALAVLVGLFFTVSKPLQENTKQMTELTAEYKNQKEWQKKHEEEFQRQVDKNSDSHERIWKHNDEQDKILTNHEARIGILERKGGD